MHPIAVGVKWKNIRFPDLFDVRQIHSHPMVSAEMSRGLPRIRADVF